MLLKLTLTNKIISRKIVVSRLETQYLSNFNRKSSKNVGKESVEKEVTNSDFLL